MADVQRLVVEDIDFLVVDKKNNGDITRSILLQVISEQEHLAEPILSQAFMIQLIRAYGSGAPVQVSARLEQALRQYLSEQPPRDRGSTPRAPPGAIRSREFTADLDRDERFDLK